MKIKREQVLLLIVSFWGLSAVGMMVKHMMISAPKRLQKMEEIACRDYQISEDIQRSTSSPLLFTLKCSPNSIPSATENRLVRKVFPSFDSESQEISLTAEQVIQLPLIRLPHWQLFISNYTFKKPSRTIRIMTDRFGHWIPQTYQETFISEPKNDE